MGKGVFHCLTSGNKQSFICFKNRIKLRFAIFDLCFKVNTCNKWISYGMTTFAQGETSRNSSTERGGGEEALSEGEQPTT